MTTSPRLDIVTLRRPLPLYAALPLAALAGPVLDAGFPDLGIWPLTFVGIAMVLVALSGRRIGSALLVGLVAGLSFYFIHIQWASTFLGPVPMAALSVLESLFFAAGAIPIALAYRWLPVAIPAVWGRLVLLPMTVGGLWTAREAIASVWPYGGFAWGRVALSQSQSPVDSLFSWVGVSGVSFIMVTLVALIIECVRVELPRRLVRAAVPIGVTMLLMLIPGFPLVMDDSIRVLAVQGNGPAGYFDERSYGDLLRAQYTETQKYAGEDVDVVLWPEGGTDVDPLKNESAADVFDYVSTEFNAPLVSGAITTDDDIIHNSSLLWEAGKGAVDEYDKRHPVPFGEYIPDRSFWRPFAPDLIDLVAREYTPGTTDSVFTIGGVVAGVNICFDIVDDQLLSESVLDGAQVLFAQSNNADFGRTDEGLQQLAIARVRALELGRSVVNISTVGTSAIVLADGSTLDQLPWYTAGAMIDDVPTSSTITPAAYLATPLAIALSALALGMLFFAGIRTRRRARG
jgi:apolipoprotein N-acyltransferase